MLQFVMRHLWLRALKKWNQQQEQALQQPDQLNWLLHWVEFHPHVEKIFVLELHLFAIRKLKCLLQELHQLEEHVPLQLRMKQHKKEHDQLELEDQILALQQIGQLLQSQEPVADRPLKLLLICHRTQLQNSHVAIPVLTTIQDVLWLPLHDHSQQHVPQLNDQGLLRRPLSLSVRQVL